MKRLILGLIVVALAACACEGSTPEVLPESSAQVALAAPEDWYEELFIVSREGDNWQDFADNCRLAWEERADTVAGLWEMDPDTELAQALFYLNVVARLWAFGNLYEPNRRGCVDQNEQIGHAKREPVFADYMESEIGCCADHALALNEILQANGFASTRVQMPGHWWVEAWADGQVWTLDATMMAAWKTSLPNKGWLALASIKFEHPGEFMGPLYRPIVPGMRDSWFSRVLRKAVP